RQTESRLGRHPTILRTPPRLAAVQRSRATAPAIATPTKMSWPYEPTPTIESPFVSVSSSSVPSTVPTIKPRPPVRLAPPITTAANTGKRSDDPALGSVEPRNEKSRIPARAASVPQRTKVTNLYRVTGSLEVRAASGLPPIANSRKPKSERWSRSPISTAKTISQTTWIGMLNGRVVAPSAENQPSSHFAGGGVLNAGAMLCALLIQ